MVDSVQHNWKGQLGIPLGRENSSFSFILHNNRNSLDTGSIVGTTSTSRVVILCARDKWNEVCIVFRKTKTSQLSKIKSPFGRKSELTLLNYDLLQLCSRMGRFQQWAIYRLLTSSWISDPKLHHNVRICCHSKTSQAGIHYSYEIKSQL